MRPATLILRLSQEDVFVKLADQNVVDHITEVKAVPHIVRTSILTTDNSVLILAKSSRSQTNKRTPQLLLHLGKHFSSYWHLYRKESFPTWYTVDVDRSQVGMKLSKWVLILEEHTPL